MKVEILDTCTACGLCETINSDVFKVNGMAHVNQDMVDLYEQDCKEAAAECPVGAITILE